MKIRRDIASIPVRSAKETWQAIVALVTGPDTVDKTQLAAASGIVESLIVDESPRETPIVFRGGGPRLVIYCLYGRAAMESGTTIDLISFNPTAGNWQATAPCEPDDVEWMNAYLAARAPRIRVHQATGRPTDEESPPAPKNLQVNWEVLKKL